MLPGGPLELPLSSGAFAVRIKENDHSRPAGTAAEKHSWSEMMAINELVVACPAADHQSANDRANLSIDHFVQVLLLFLDA
ncbi:hypothetical protein TPS_03458 [Trichinella pseudospiralis]